MKTSAGWRDGCSKCGGGVLGLGLSLCFGMAVAAALGLRINDSASLPRGLYRVRAGWISRGARVLVCPPEAAARLALSRRYLHPGDCPGGVVPLGKLVLAVGGDRVEVQRSVIAVNGVPVPQSTSRDRDEQGRRLPTTVGRSFRLQPDQVWLYAPHPRSFDSRVFGPVVRSAIRGVLVPIWTEGDGVRREDSRGRPAKDSGTTGR